ncbi:hypothetical protein [Neisseria musculi]|uniref:hypothetical protein n=1 Tax=Neisseria musculi TaxID=1815583 RepID=UPI00336BD9F5
MFIFWQEIAEQFQHDVSQKLCALNKQTIEYYEKLVHKYGFHRKYEKGNYDFAPNDRQLSILSAICANAVDITLPASPQLTFLHSYYFEIRLKNQEYICTFCMIKSHFNEDS